MFYEGHVHTLPRSLAINIVSLEVFPFPDWKIREKYLWVFLAFERYLLFLFLKREREREVE